ncbi:Golgi to ER traffic protein 4 [Termitomyces sp. T112]|nr:hypothetical protein C0989_012230 [Termitomyces sp. Mn162]KAG5726383.1 Golgi to ER traffic protein 4 [Termitomyces sp. T112]KAH0585562.1 hypothetical protein H2248_008792 [Termitomyces sp. 'cryptogamus']KNZ73370.1 Golgi to ER traffic protein 4 [Termitomyces sp. J132]
MASSSSRALNAILPQIASVPYEAHQKARTFASRYIKSGQYDTAIDVLFQSARELLKAGQLGSGIDLAGFLLEVYETKGEAVSGESRGRLTQLIALTGPNGTWRKTLIDKALAWTVNHGDCPAGDQDLHHYVGELLYKEGVFDAAERHFLASGKRDSARLLAEMFTVWSAEGGTAGVFALRGVIPYLQNGNILAARTFISTFSAGVPKNTTVTLGDDEVVLTQDQVVNFAQIAVVTCQRAQGEKNKLMRESWVRLCGTYQSRGGVLALPEVRAPLNEIGNLYFAIPLPRTQQTNPMGDIMSTLFGTPKDQQPVRRLTTPGISSGLD